MQQEFKYLKETHLHEFCWKFHWSAAEIWDEISWYQSLADVAQNDPR